MRVVANLVGILSVVPLVWLAFYFSDLSIGQKMIYTIAICGAAGLGCLYFWQPDGLLDTTDFGFVGPVLGGTAVLILFFLVVDAVFAGVNPFKPEEWENLWKSSGMFGFAFTIGFAALFAMFSVATVIRMAVLRLHSALTPGGTDGP